MQSIIIRLVTALAIGSACCSPSALAQGQGDQIPASGALELGQFELVLLPIEAWTTASHPAPASLTVPTGTWLILEHHTPPGFGSSWVGAVSFLDEPGLSQAAFRMDSEGRTTITAIAVPFGLVGQPGEVIEQTCTIQFVDAPLGRAATAIDLAGEMFTVTDGKVPNAVGLHFGASIASVSELAPGHWVTSIDRPVTAVAESTSPFSSLIEWRINGRAEALGAEATMTFPDAGQRNIEAGPPGGAVFARLDIYEAAIVAQTPDIDLIPGVAFQFLAVTDPPGFEDFITWMPSTAHGSAQPVLGRGPVFQAVFRDTYSPGGIQWVGVKADNATLANDGPELGACCFPDQSCGVTTFLSCNSLGGTFAAGASCYDVNCK